MQVSQRELPIIDLAGVFDGDPQLRDQAAQAVMQACEQFGFFYIRNHGVPDAVVSDLVDVATRFFAQPADVKDQSRAIDHRGYIAQGDAQMKGATKADFKESFMIGLDLPPDDPARLAGEGLRGANRWPDTPPDFRDKASAYSQALGNCGRSLLGVVARALGVSDDFFESRYDKPLQRSNIIHYPPSPANDDDQFGVAPHTDYGCITLLWQDDRGGLHVRDRSTGDWILAKPIPGTFVVNVGDLLERWSNGRLKSTEHRVVNTSGAERYSIATFYDPTYSATADPVDLGITAVKSRFEPVVCGDYILGRVRESFEYRAPVASR